MKLQIQAQHLKPGDVVGSGERIKNITINSTHWPSNKIQVVLEKAEPNYSVRTTYWGKRTMINVERVEDKYDGGLTDEDLGVKDYGP
jgi:hypothetical protein